MKDKKAKDDAGISRCTIIEDVLSAFIGPIPFKQSENEKSSNKTISIYQ